MASAGRRDLPVYPLANIQPRTRHMLLAPAIRWRVIVEQVSEITHDIILETVLQIRDAGEKQAHRIADRLQLPEDLIRHLLAQAATEGMRVSQDGDLQATSSRVAWVYRDIATGELWPDPGDEVPPLPVRFQSQSRYQAQFDRGSAGRPDIVRCLLLDTPETTAAEPTSIELARFSRSSSDLNRRTAIVSSGEPCLVASPVVGQTAGCFVETTRGVPHVSLTQQLVKAGQQYSSVSRWLAGVPKRTAPKGGELPLRRALTDLRDVRAEQASSPSGADPEALLSRVELCLSRFVDQFQYYHGVSAGDPAAESVTTLCGSSGLSADAAGLLLKAARGSAGFKTAGLLLGDFDGDRSMLADLATAAAQLTVLAQAPEGTPELASLVESTIDLCERLMTSLEDAGVQQAEQEPQGQ